MDDDDSDLDSDEDSEEEDSSDDNINRRYDSGKAHPLASVHPSVAFFSGMDVGRGRC
jgi:hypothetical protein